MKYVIKLEIVRQLTTLYLVCFATYLILSIAVLQVGIETFKTDEKQSIQFVKTQTKRVEGFINYQQYGAFGLKRILTASPLISMFYNSSTISNLQANVEISTQFELYKTEMGKNVFERPTGGNLDYSWYLLMFGSSIIALWSFFAFRNDDYIIFLKNGAGAKSIYAGILAARAIVVVLSLLTLAAAAWLQFTINGITLSAGELLGLMTFFLMAVVVQVILIPVMAGLGAEKNWKKGALKAAAFWVIVVLIWPEVLNIGFARKAEVSMKSIEEYQMQKNEKFQAFEKGALENTGRYKSIPAKKESDRRSAEHYWQVVSKEIEKNDLEMIEKTREMARDFQLWSIFNPVTFYKSINNELGSKGYGSYNRFFKENLFIQRGFLRFVFDKRYYENYSRVEPYLPAGRLVVSYLPGLPGFFTAGLLLNLFYMATAFLFGYKGFKRHVFPLPRAAGGYGAVDIRAGSGEVVFVTCENEDLYVQVIDVFNGYARGFDGKITVDNRNAAEGETGDCAYVPNQGKVPGNYTVGFFIHNGGKMMGISPDRLEELKREKEGILKKRLGDIGACERACLLLDLCRAGDFKVVLLRDFKKGVPGKLFTRVIDKLQALKEKGAVIISLSEVFMGPDKVYDYSYDDEEGKYEDLKDFAGLIGEKRL